MGDKLNDIWMAFLFLSLLILLFFTKIPIFLHAIGYEEEAKMIWNLANRIMDYLFG